MPGSGKTYSLAEVGAAYIGRGWPVWCNLGFDLEGALVYRSFAELAAIRGPACILIDEAQLFFNARKWQEFPDGFLYQLSQVRKFQIHLYYTTLRWGMIDINLRNMTFWVWECEAAHRRGRFVRRRFPPEESRQKDERCADKHRVKVTPSIASMYDTMSNVAVAPTVNVKARELAEWSTGGAQRPAGPEHRTGDTPAGAPPAEQGPPPRGRSSRK